MRRIFPYIIITITVLILLTFNFPFASGFATEDVSANLRDRKTGILNIIDCKRILSHVANLSTLGSRVTGYDGNLLAASYIADKFKEYGLEVKIQKFKVAVPIDLGTNITVISPINRVFEAFALWPNGIQTCSVEKLEGRLIYAPGFNLQDFDGKNLRGSIVLMEFNTGENWLFLANMGAKAVIFVEPNDTSSSEVMSKRVDAPLHFPRLFVRRDVGNQLIALIKNSTGEVYVRINSSIVWREVEAQNVIGIVNGTQNPNDVIILASHYDTWSIVPKIAYGANDALGVALLLELARHFAVNKPLRTIWFVAFSGHWQALAGGREFIENFYFSKEVQEGTVKPWVFIGLGPFSWDTNELQLLGISYYSGAGQQLGTLNQRYIWIVRQIFNKYLTDSDLSQAVNELTGRTPTSLLYESLSNLMWWGSMQNPYILESELVLMTGAIGFSITSSPTLAYDKFFGVPLNDISSIRIEQLKPQFTIISFMLDSLVNESEWPLRWTDVKPVRATTIGYAWGPAQNAGFITMLGRVALFNYTEGWYRTVPNAIVCAYSLSNAYPFSRIYAISDENGTFEIHGIPPFTLSYARSGWAVEAYVLNETDGTILYAPDLGIHGAQTFTTQIMPLTHPMQITIVVANLRSITVFDVLDPRYIRPLAILDPRSKLLPVSDLYVSVGGKILPLDFELRSELLAYGVSYNPWETVALIFAPPYSKNAITLKTGTLTGTISPWPIFLTNSSEGSPEGFGIKVGNEPVTVHFTVYNVAKDMYWTTKYRYDNLKAYNVRSLSVEEALNNTAEYLRLAKTFYDNNTYSKAYSYAVLAYTWANRAYLESMSLIQDTATATISMFALIIVTSFIIERLLINAERGERRLIALAAITVAFTLILSQLHPSLRLMSNTIMGLFGSILMVLFAMVLVILASEVEKVASALSVRLLGKHALERARIGTVMVGFSTSIRFMRRHRLRTFLTLITAFTITSSIVSLTSTSPYIQLRTVPTPYEVANPLYETGIFLEKDYGIPPLGPLSKELPNVIQQILGEKFAVMPRIVYFPQVVRYLGGVKLNVYSKKSSISISAVVGISPVESTLLAEKSAESGSRGFLETDYNVCFLTTAQAQALNVSCGDVITFKGYKMVVVGILDGSVLNQIMDLNGLQIGAPDPMYVRQFAKDLTYPEQVATIPRIGWDQVLMVPSKFALDMGGYVASINIVPVSRDASTSDLEKLAQDLASCLDVNVWFKIGESTFSISRVHAYYMLGYEALLVLVVIATLNIVMSILANVRERMREIQVLALTGLSPVGSMSIVLMESVIYALIGSLFGYFAGYALNSLFTSIGLLPAYFPLNYASISILSSIALVIVISFLGALFPAFTAARIVTPSLRRKWELPTKPRGDEWAIPLPFRIPTKREALGMLHFLKEYFDGGGAIGHMYMVTKTGSVSHEEMALEMEIKHAPYEMLILSNVIIRVLQEGNVFSFHVYLKRTSGSRRMWAFSSYYFVDTLRKQLMLWRSLTQSEHEKYMRGV